MKKIIIAFVLVTCVVGAFWSKKPKEHLKDAAKSYTKETLKQKTVDFVKSTTPDPQQRKEELLKMEKKHATAEGPTVGETLKEKAARKSIEKTKETIKSKAAETVEDLKHRMTPGASDEHGAKSKTAAAQEKLRETIDRMKHRHPEGEPVM